MKAPADKSPEPQRQAAAHEAPQQQERSDAELQFIDNRAETASLLQLQETVDNSPRRQRLAQLKAMMNNSPRSGAMQSLQAMVDNNPRRASMGSQAGTDGVTVQRVEDEEVLQGKFAAESPAQLAQPSDAKPNNTGLPDNLKAGVESLSGMSLDNVKVHYNSSESAQLNARAYAQGTDIHLGPGQEQHLPHEAWHVVQQAQGRVKPTVQMKDGVEVNDDGGLEREADLMGGKAVAGVVQGRRELGGSTQTDPIGSTQNEFVCDKQYRKPIGHNRAPSPSISQERPLQRAMVVQRIMTTKLLKRFGELRIRYFRLKKYWPALEARQNNLAGEDLATFKAIIDNNGPKGWNTLKEIGKLLNEKNLNEKTEDECGGDLDIAEGYLDNLESDYGVLIGLANYDPIGIAKKQYFEKKQNEENAAEKKAANKKKKQKKKEKATEIDMNKHAKENTPDALLSAGAWKTKNTGISGFISDHLDSGTIQIGTICDLYRTKEDKGLKCYSIKIKIIGMTKHVIHAHIDMGQHKVSAKGKNPVHIKKTSANNIEDGMSYHVVIYELIVPKHAQVMAAFHNRKNMPSWDPSDWDL